MIQNRLVPCESTSQRESSFVLAFRSASVAVFVVVVYFVVYVVVMVVVVIVVFVIVVVVVVVVGDSIGDQRRGVSWYFSPR